MAMILIWNNNETYGNEAGENQGEGTQIVQKRVEQVLKEHTDDLMSLPGVVSTIQGLCNGQPCIKVFIDRIKTKVGAENSHESPRLSSCDPTDKKVQIIWGHPAMMIDY